MTAVDCDSTWQFPVMVSEMHYDHKADFTVMSGEHSIMGAPFPMSVCVSGVYSLQGGNIK